MSHFRFVMPVALVLVASACASHPPKPTAEFVSSSVPLSDTDAHIDDDATAHSPMVTSDGTAGDSYGSYSQAAAAPGTAQDPNGTSTRTSDSAKTTSDDAFDAAADTAILEERTKDPWERFNRRVYGFNSTLDRFAIRPLGIVYEKITPDPVQAHVTSFFHNLGEPRTAINQMLQGRPVGTLQTMGRFAVNVTVGIGGAFDPASRFGMPGYEEDFGQTLAEWGWHDSRYLVLPLLGPRTVRDSVGMVGDQPLSSIGYVNDDVVANGLNILQLMDARARVLPMDDARAQAADEYALVRDTWMQHRLYKIEQDQHGNID